MSEELNKNLNTTSVETDFKKIKDMDGKNKNIILSENSKVILEKRYLRKDENQEVSETIEEMFNRVASTVAKPDVKYRDSVKTEQDFYNLLKLWRGAKGSKFLQQKLIKLFGIKIK